MPSSDPNAVHQEDASAELIKLRRGELTLDQYIDHKASLATRHLEKLLSPEQLEIVRDTVRTQMTSNPTTVELLRRTTSVSSDRKS